MIKKVLSLSLFTFLYTNNLFAQSGFPAGGSEKAVANCLLSDSVITAVHPSYNDVSGIHKWLFGANYREEWAMPVKLPLIRISKFCGGLTPVKQGGGLESKSLRLTDVHGNEWILRSVEKSPEKLLPLNLQGTFAVDWVGDEFSGQHPYSALIVPPLAEAAGVPHANPVIGVVADETALGEFRSLFAGSVCLLEEREPIGQSVNTIRLEKALVADYNNHVDGKLFLRARLLDLLVGDWDRHEDQWRWAKVKGSAGKAYQAVPRDRDQVFHINQGLFPGIAALPWINPVLGDFDGGIRMKYDIFKTRFMGAFPDAQMSYIEWMAITNDFVKAETDKVLEAGLKRLPRESYVLRHQEFLRILKERRDALPGAMSDYYNFIHRIVDIRTTDKQEQIVITDAPGNAMHISISPADDKQYAGKPTWDLTYNPETTKEIRLYLQGGNDRLQMDCHSPILLRIIDSAGNKSFNIKNAGRKLQFYTHRDSDFFSGDRKIIKTHFLKDTASIRFFPVNLYNVWTPLATAAANADDGFLIGLGFRYTGHDGFQKGAYSSLHELLITHAFATQAFRLNYHGEWIKALGKADLVTDVKIQAPDNTMNFFGTGNETALNKIGDYHKFYRARFDIYRIDPSLRWKTGNNASISIGTFFEFYHLNGEANDGRFISTAGAMNVYDAATLQRDKAHAGLKVDFTTNQRDNNMLPTNGYFLDVTASGYQGLNNYSRSFARITAEFTFYQKADPAGRVIFSDRIGGGLTAGKPAFYQSMYLGGQGNLLGFLQNRFAGKHMAYNNLQGRIRLANIAGYILPGQLGVTGFYDTGRVWAEGDHSDKWHQGTGGGLYFSPANLTIIQVLAGHSEEGWYPYISLNVRL
ncbi:BamA/TamA family outer membrane protein [Mucilaginibacter rigui]|uniref:BamA/TamA family outer membrane protein n=1 Tax=Mucilaginibacter rigui TaxID=534635 RepID=A0ABR7X5R5_9SPHI|nr:BamA/TamA family outer membrane protein [Mucilaginibacter rigui]MBD1385928.1 BamA/TamA family outer membrane protein [Mucilaginibacter rigui]